MRTLIGLAVCIAAFVAPSYGQQPSVTWQRVIAVPGNRGQIDQLVLAQNGDIIVSGFINREGKDVQGSTSDAWLARYSANGNQLWSRTFGGENRDAVSDLKLDNDGSIIVAGMANVRLDKTVRSVRSDGFVARYSSGGDLIWNTTVSGELRVSLNALILMEDGSILAAGEDTPEGASGSRALVIKLKREGGSAWEFNPPDFVEGKTPAIGSIQFSTTTGKSYVNESARLGNVERDKLHVQAMQNTLVDLQPARCFSVLLTTGVGLEETCAPATSPSMFTTERVGLFEDDDVNVRKHDASGGVIWDRTFPTENGDGINVLAPTADGGVIGAGYLIDGPKVGRHNWDGLLIKLDANGDVVWRRTFGGGRRDELKGVAILPDGSLIVAGYTGSQSGAADWNPWIMRLNSSGELEAEALKELQSRQK
ncbi:MAG: hypothetical protein QM773_21685 [Hyphomonadaceae bacterium]